MTVAFGRRNAIGKSAIESHRYYAVTWVFEDFLVTDIIGSFIFR